MTQSELNLVEASIEDLQNALASGSVTSVDLVARYLRRISTYDCRNIALNSIPIINNAVFEEAARSDDRRAAGSPLGALEGIPYTIKDSYKVKGMAAAAGSPAFKDLTPNEDAFVVKTFRDAGAVLIGRTNMPSMACGGMQRGIWGRSENPYNLEYLAAGCASGSSHGSAVSTAASFAAFGVGGETVSSGRSPASNNALVAYTPSRSYLSVRGSWPLYPTCDVVVPHTRSMKDMLRLLDVMAVEDPIKAGDFWREQTLTQLPQPWQGKPASFKELTSSTSLSGLRVAVPEMFLGGHVPEGTREVKTSPAVIELWKQARQDLEALGAEIVMVPDFPAQTAYENNSLLPEGCPRLPEGWAAMERGPLIAHAWNDFVKECKDAKIPDLSAVDPFSIYPDSLRTEPELKYLEKPNAIQYHKFAEFLQTTSFFEVEGLKEAIEALEGMRSVLLEKWLTDLGCDFVAFPSAADVGPANADSSFEGAELAWRNGVYYSNGNRAMRHLGIPSVSVPMGIMSDKGVPVNLTFAGRAYDDINLLKWANAFEVKSMRRVPPPNTPPLDSDTISLSGSGPTSRTVRPTLDIEKYDATPNEDGAFLRIKVQGLVHTITSSTATPEIEITVDGSLVPSDNITIEALPQTNGNESHVRFTAWEMTPKPIQRDGLDRTVATVARDKVMAVVLARAALGGRPTGWIGMI